ncbi:acyltransferase family protein [Leifsonia poae]|uniref:acyltransferase family protein n=1 Tax=Leifsonia poae TaxID=110933 RepID=UPI001CBE968E|nr:acyltransferase [Leifsonia poae]
MFDPRLNALNVVRLLLAVSVIVWHSFPLTGASRPPWPVVQLLGEAGVDGFFAISGFLIVASWMRNPRWRPYLRARVLRILPAFYFCLVVTAFVLAPLGILLVGQGFPDGYLGDSLLYVLKNAGLRIVEAGIGGTPEGVLPYPGVWNGSLWTLWWEFLCYLGVLILGLTRLLRFRVTVPILFIACLGGVALTAAGILDNAELINGSRFGLMFAAGALIHQVKDRLPARWWLVGIAAAITITASVLPDYRLVAALPLAYLLIAGGALVKIPGLRLRNDVSYGTYIYAFPLQQVLASAGLAALGVPVFAAVATILTLGVATLSWHLIEKRALRWKRSRAGMTPESVTLTAGPA